MCAICHLIAEKFRITSKNLMRVGTQHTSDFNLQRKIIQVNIASVVAILNIAVYNLMFWWVGNHGLIISGLVQIPIVLLAFGLVLWMHKLGHIELARWTLFFGVIFDVAAALTASQGTVIFIHGYYLVFAVVSPIFFPSGRWRSMILIAFLNLAMFSFFQIHGWPARPETLTLPKQIVAIFVTVMACSCIITVVTMMLISENSAARNEAELQMMADTDPLTKLANRRAFRVRLKRDLEQLNRQGGNIAIAMIDVDFFRRINEDYGHDMGDSILRLLANLLLDQVRAEDTLARIGGEKFALLLPQTLPQQALIVTERMRKIVEESLFGPTQSPMRISISIGLASIERDMRADQAINAADEALTQAKLHGRNRIIVQS